MSIFDNVKSITIDGTPIKSITANNGTIWSLSSSSDEDHSEYQFVEYIETDGNQYIDTGVLASNYNNGISYIFKGNITKFKVSNGVNYLFGAIKDNKRSGNAAINTYYTTNYPCRFIIGGIINLRMGIVDHVYPQPGEDFELKAFGNPNLPDDTEFSCVINDVYYRGVNSSYTGASAMPDANIYLFWMNGSTSASQYYGKLYNFTMNAADGTPIRNFVPCYRKADNVIGLYDTVEGKFYTNAGTGSFTKGADVT